MEPIKDSPIKEAMRLQNLKEAEEKANLLRRDLQKRSENGAMNCFWISCIATVVFLVMGAGCVSVVAGIITFIMVSMIFGEQKQDIEKQIKHIYWEADKITEQQIKEYENKVKQKCLEMQKKEKIISLMVDHVVNMFQRMVSHADSSSYMMFIEADFSYKVTLTGIVYNYQSGYTNPQDDFVFFKQNFRNLTTTEECEGLAEALAIMVIRKMKRIYSADACNIVVSHVDAEVTMHFKAANKNFTKPKNIF